MWDGSDWQTIKGPQGSQGPQGNAGREIEVQKGATHLQWRYVGDAEWTDLAALSEITGPQGEQGIQGEQGPQGETGTAATIAVGTTTTGEPGTDAEVVNSGTASAAVLDFTIPQGDPGDGVEIVSEDAETITVEFGGAPRVPSAVGQDAGLVVQTDGADGFELAEPASGVPDPSAEDDGLVLTTASGAAVWAPSAGVTAREVAALHLRNVAVYDTFDRADGALGSAASGQAWTDRVGTWAIASGEAGPTALSSGVAIATVSLGALPRSVEAMLFPPGSTPYAGVILLWIDASNYVAVLARGTGLLSIVQVLADTPSTLASATSQIYVEGTYARVRGVVAERTGVCRVGATCDEMPDTALTATADSTFLAATHAGLYATNVNAHVATFLARARTLQF